MINRITMETVACLRNKCHLKQNLIPSWPWSFRHTSYISDFRCKTKYCRTPGLAYLAVLPVLVIFCQLCPKVRRISKVWAIMISLPVYPPGKIVAIYFDESRRHFWKFCWVLSLENFGESQLTMASPELL